MLQSTLFPVKEVPAVGYPFDELGDVVLMDNTGYKFIIREDTGKVLSCMTNDYKLVNNQEIINAAEPILKQHNAQLKEAVSFGNGQQTTWKWIIPDVKIEISKGDLMNPEIIIKNSYDGTTQVHILSGAFRLVCSNGMIIGNIIEKYNYKHNIGNINLDNLDESIENTIIYARKVGEEFPALKDKKLKQKHIVNLIQLFPSTMSEFITQYLVANKPKNYWDLFNVATYINTHKMNRKYNSTHQLESRIYPNISKWAKA